MNDNPQGLLNDNLQDPSAPGEGWARYFYHVRDGDRLDPDPRPSGVQLASLEAARGEAIRMAVEMLQAGGDSFADLAFEVVDESGALLFTFPFAEASHGTGPRPSANQRLTPTGERR